MPRAEPFVLLQLRRHLKVNFAGADGNDGGFERFGSLAAALKDVALQPALLELCIRKADTAQPALMGALVDAALARRLRKLSLEDCTPPAAAPLARLLAGGSLAALEIYMPQDPAGPPLFDAAGAALAADALRVNTTLKSLRLYGAHLSVDMHMAGALLGALVGHPSLRSLDVYDENTTVEARIAFGAALAALIAADAPALQILVCNRDKLGDAGLAPIVEALRLNRHLHQLNVGNNGMSKEFARERLLPAVRANTSLHWLACINDETGPSAAEAMELVRRRGPYG
jgi:hypothetical protein